jgi:mRNA-degrading endonuclease RelE of RelBE toxin-antitoxin system
LKPIALTHSLRAQLRKLPKPFRRKVGERLQQLEQAFGDPHQHLGLGIRPLKRDDYEIRLDLKQRLVFKNNPDQLVALFIGNHNEVQRYLKSR